MGSEGKPHEPGNESPVAANVLGGARGRVSRWETGRKGEKMKTLVLVQILGVAGGFITGYKVGYYRMRVKLRRLNAQFIRYRNRTMGIPPTTRRDADWRFADNGNNPWSEASERIAPPVQEP